jgi:hypothetical protein
MKHTLVVAAMLTSITFVASTSFAQQGMGPGGGARRGGRIYDPKTVETIRGEVLSVEQIHGTGRKGGRGYGVHLMVKTDKEEISVHLGPGWYIEKQSLKIVPKDTIEVRGSRIMSEGKPAIIAAEVKKGDQVLKLRDTNGVPAWSGGRGR